MPTLQLIQENSTTCPVTTPGSNGVSLPLLLVGAVGVIAVAGIVYSTGDKSETKVG